MANEEKARILASFFKTGKGEYGEGDVFLGIPVGETRMVVKKNLPVSLDSIDSLLKEKIHEYRMAGWMALVARFNKSDEQGRKDCFDFAVKRLEFANNWDLVDLTMPTVLGEYLLDKDRSCLFAWSRSENLWVQRSSVLATFAFIKKGDCSTTLELAEALVDHPHDLMRKAVGWMLRESAKRASKRKVVDFLLKHYKTMPRVALRYAIERFSKEERDFFMGRSEHAPDTLMEEGLC